MGLLIFYFCLSLYLFGDLAIYGSAVPKSIRDVIWFVETKSIIFYTKKRFFHISVRMNHRIVRIGQCMIYVGQVPH